MPRQREFDPDEVLEKAMEVFWAQGYEATSVQDLVDQMGINRFSLYNTFGNKHRLFLAALDRYHEKVVGELLAVMNKSEEGVPAIREFLEGFVELYTSRTPSQGCLMINSALELLPHDRATHDKVVRNFERIEKALHRALVRAQRRGDLRSQHSLRDLARFLVGSAQGLGVLAKSFPGRKVLQGFVNVALCAL